jgi:hypothetical protein
MPNGCWTRLLQILFPPAIRSLRCRTRALTPSVPKRSGRNTRLQILQLVRRCLRKGKAPEALSTPVRPRAESTLDPMSFWMPRLSGARLQRLSPTPFRQELRPRRRRNSHRQQLQVERPAAGPLRLGPATLNMTQFRHPRLNLRVIGIC